MIPASVREQVKARDGGRCCRCGATAESIHHRKPRGMGGTRDDRANDLRNLVSLCGSGTTGCHGRIEAHRRQAYEAGWLLRSYDALDTPMLCPNGVLVTLDEDGSLRRERDGASLALAELVYTQGDVLDAEALDVPTEDEPTEAGA